MTIEDFIRARLNEDEEKANASVEWLVNGGRLGFEWEDLPEPIRALIWRWLPVRVLRQVEAMRRVLDMHIYEPAGGDVYMEALHLLATEWADHPDYRAEWAP